MSIDHELFLGRLTTPEAQDLPDNTHDIVKKLVESVRDGCCTDCHAFIAVAQLDSKKAEEFLLGVLHAKANSEPRQIAMLFPDPSESDAEQLFNLPCILDLIRWISNEN